MSGIGDTIREHPAMAAGAVALGLVVLYLMLSSGSSSAATSTGTTTDPGVQAAEIQAASNMATAQLSYQANKDQLDSASNIAALTTQADLLAHYSDNDTALKVAGIQAGVAGLGYQVQAKQIDADTTQQLAQYKQLTDVAAISAGVNLASIAANRDTSIAQTSAMADAQKYTALLGAQTSQALSRDMANTNASNQKAATAQKGLGLLGNIISGAGALFSFL